MGRAAGAAAIALGWLAAVAALQLAPLRPDADLPWRWPPALAVLAASCGCLPDRLRFVAGFLVAALAGWILVPSWDGLLASRGVLRLVIGAFVLAYWFLPRLTPAARWGAGALAVAAVAAALILERSRSGLFAQMAGALAGALTGLMVVSHRPTVLAGAMPVVAVLLPGLLASGRFNSHSDVPLASYLLCALAPLGLAIPGRTLLRFGVVALIAGCTVAIAYWAEPGASLLLTAAPVTSHGEAVR